MIRFRSVLVILSCALMLSVLQAQDPPPAGGQPPGGGPGGQGPGGRGPGGRGPGGRGPGGPGGFGFQMPPFPLLEALDVDKDGKLSKEEVENAVTALKQLDKDADGKLSKEEIGWPPAFMGRGGPGGFGGGPGMGFGGPGSGFGPGGPGGFGGGPGGNIVERIMSNDKDGDGKVTQAELPEAMQRIMQRADTNKDGAIDKAEAEVLAQAMSQRGGSGRGPGPAGEQPEQPKRTDPPTTNES
ncbi:MAG: EF-hand domain-containing protein [Pirellulaceae bacterium]